MQKEKKAALAKRAKSPKSTLTTVLVKPKKRAKRGKYGKTDVATGLFHGVTLDSDGAVDEGQHPADGQPYLNQQGLTPKERRAYHNFMFRRRKWLKKNGGKVKMVRLPTMGGAAVHAAVTEMRDQSSYRQKWVGPFPRIGGPAADINRESRRYAIGFVRGQVQTIEDLMPELQTLIGKWWILGRSETQIEDLRAFADRQLKRMGQLIQDQELMPEPA